MNIIISNRTSKPIYEQIASQIKGSIMSGELQAGEALPSMRALAKSLKVSVLTVQNAYECLQRDGFIETTAGKGCFVSAQNQDFYLEEQQKKIEELFIAAIEIARCSGIKQEKLETLLKVLCEEE
ncbi:GntR family transcriptional regulator [Roseburia hominis]